MVRGPAFRLAVDPGLAATLCEVADAGHVVGAFLDADDAARLAQVEQMARFDRLVIGGERNLRRARAMTFALGGLETREQRVGVGNHELPFPKLSAQESVVQGRRWSVRVET